ncbi:MAG: adenylate/guanylate cyclase domain-containing protein [Candidatus Velamenicoccus archaeovorus]
MQICPNCGEENPDRFRLCGICGTQLAPAAPAQEVRKTVSIVFSDLKGSTNLGEQLDTESLREVLNVYFTEMKAVLERHGGTVEKFIGDAIMAVFGLPRLHEDDALRAVRAAYEMKVKLAEINERLEAGWGVRLENRTGVNTGEVVAGDVTAGQRLVTGDAVNTAARLEQNAPACEVLVGEPTFRLVKDAVEVEPVEPLELKGKAERVPAYLLKGIRQAEEGISRRLDAPMVGRRTELAVLMEALNRAVAERRAQLVTVFGPAGVGKSRLLREFIANAGDGVRTLRGHCLSYGEGITFWPLAEVVREAAGIEDDDSLEEARNKLVAMAGEDAWDAIERVAAAIGLSNETFPVQETFWGARRLAERLADDQASIVVIDDIHWAEDTFLELLRYLADNTAAPLVLVCSSRPELLENHAEWIQERDRVNTVILEPLSEEESGHVIENLLGTTAFDERVRARIIEAAEGNPLFVEQMLSMLIDDGILSRDHGDWVLTSDIGAITIPPSISALLSARLDRLGTTERTVIERGAVIGTTFFRGAVEDLSPPEVRVHVGESLGSLLRKELIHEGASDFAGQETYRFLHALIRDAAYHGLLKRTRAELHERFVDWLERIASDRVMEFEEIRGYHLEQAFLILAALGPIDDHRRELGIRGSRYLSSAGDRALARGDMPAASSLLRRAGTLLPQTDPVRPRLLLRAGEALIETGEFTQADIVLTQAVSEAEDLQDVALQTTANLVRMLLAYSTGTELSEAEVVAEVERTLPILESLEDHQGLARAWRLLLLVHWNACRWGTAEGPAQRIVEEARLAGDRVLEVRMLSALATCALYGPTPVPQAIERCEELLRAAAGDRKATALTMCSLSHLEAMRGNFERARELYRQSRAALEELGWNLLAALTSIDSGAVEMLADDPVAAEVELRRDYDTLQRMGERNYISTTAAFLAAALFEQGRFEDAEASTRESEEIAAPDDVSTQFLWRSIRAKIHAHAGRHEEAEALSREAVALIRASEEPDSQATALSDLGEVLRLAGKPEEASVALEEALALYGAKGNVVAFERTRRRLEQVGLAREGSVRL